MPCVDAFSPCSLAGIASPTRCGRSARCCSKTGAPPPSASAPAYCVLRMMHGFIVKLPFLYLIVLLYSFLACKRSFYNVNAYFIVIRIQRAQEPGHTNIPLCRSGISPSAPSLLKDLSALCYFVLNICYDVFSKNCEKSTIAGYNLL